MEKISDGKSKIIEELEKLVQQVLDLKSSRTQRRPLFIEFCGSPKSGKSTTINSLSMFFRRNGLKTAVLTERAGICPIQNKTHPNFNIWTLCSVIADMLEKMEHGKEKIDIIIADRGIFDALCWFNWLNTNPSDKNPYLSNENFKELTTFINSDIWKRNIDLIYVFIVDPKTSIEREYSALLTEKRGSIMREDVLETYNTSVKQVITEYSQYYRQVKKIKTDEDDLSGNPNKVNYMVTKLVLQNLIELMDEKIGYIPMEVLQDKNLLSSLKETKLLFGNRSEVEKDSKAVQPIPIAVITNKSRNKLLVVKKNAKTTDKNSPEKDKLLGYIGGHVRYEDNVKDDFFKTIQNALHREIQEEINESVSICATDPILIYANDNERSRRHLAICYIVEMDLDNKQFKITSDELTMKSGTSKSGKVMTPHELVSETLEKWTIEILDKIFKIKYNINQEELFN